MPEDNYDKCFRNGRLGDGSIDVDTYNTSFISKQARQ